MNTIISHKPIVTASQYSTESLISNMSMFQHLLKNMQEK